jgi:hypothetical protein
VVGVLACLAAALALSAPPALATEACPNEQVRRESNTNPVTGQPYSAGLPGRPDCRAYEMVSPLYKQAHDAKPIEPGGFSVAPDGDVVGFASEGAFANPENYRVNLDPINIYLSQRGASGWVTSSAFAPRKIVDSPFLNGLEGDASIDLRSVQVSCGTSPAGKGEAGGSGQNVVCALRKPDGSWVSTPTYTAVNNTPIGIAGATTYLGGSADLARVFIQPPVPLRGSDKLGARGIYEIAGVGTASAELRLVNVDNSGNELLLTEEGVTQALLGDRGSKGPFGNDYHAVSESGETVFFTAWPVGSERQTIYARVHCAAGSPPPCKEEGNNEWLETIPVSNPSASECTACKEVTTGRATFQGASADGSKVFFTTTEPLLSEDITENLYEYDFAKPEGEKLMLLSAPPGGKAEVEGVVRISSDGSHVYFVAHSVLTSVPNGNNETAGNFDDLYGYDTGTNEVKFVAASNDNIESEDGRRHAQTTPDGRYLAFSTHERLAGDTNCKETGGTEECAQAVYRYDFETGELTWVSRAAPGFTPTNEAKDAIVAPAPAPASQGSIGAYASIDDWGRAISADGSHIIFTTSERLQGTDVNNAPDVYEWRCASPCGAPAAEGSVGMISDGRDPHGIGPADAVSGMSASGSDIFFATHTPLVGQDTDVLGDVYDARVGGGFPAPAAEPSCSGDACQGPRAPLRSFGPLASSFKVAPSPVPPPVSIVPATKSKPNALEARRKVLRYVLNHYGCRTRVHKGERLGPRCRRWFAEGDAINRQIAGKAARAPVTTSYRRGK